MDSPSQPGSPVARLPHRPSVSSVRSPRSSSRLSAASSRHSIAGLAGATAPSKSSDDDSKTAVKVAIRVRPPLEPTDPGFDLIPQRFRASTCEVPSPTNLIVTSPQGKKIFVFDRVFDEEVTQEGIWSYLSDSVSSFVQGYNVSILAYGQSGAGKSYTMGTAGPDQVPESTSAGVIPRAAQALFDKLNGSPGPRSGLRSPQRYSAHGIPTLGGMHKQQPSIDKNWQLKATYLEIYNEHLRDLLVPESVPHGDRPTVSIREDVKGRILLTGLTQVPINSVEDVLNALSFGSAIRQTDATAINAKSSRSHAIFSLNLVQKRGAQPASRDKRMSMPLEAASLDESTVTLDSKLHFVDLAGSERLKNTGAQGERAKEGISINAGLASLGKVIAQLSSRQPGGYISYRDSRLTRLLQDSLGGNAITYMVACVTPAEFHLSETLNTVTYAQRARAIQSKPEIQQTHDDKDTTARVERLQAEVAFLREQIKHERSQEQQHSSTNGDARPGRRETELQNQLMDVQESYNALNQRHAKLIAEISKAREDHDEDTPTLREAIGDSALERLKRSNSLSQAVEQVIMEYEKTIQSLEASLSTTRSTLSSSESSLMERESKITYMENLAQQLQSRLQKASDRENNNDAYLRELETQIEGATSSEEKSAALVASLRRELSRVKENETNAEEYIGTLEERLAEAEQDQEIMQREIDRLEHVVERQRSIGRLDNLLAELDGIRKNEVDDKAGLKKANGHGNSNGDHEPQIEDHVTQESYDNAATEHQPMSEDDVVPEVSEDTPKPGTTEVSHGETQTSRPGSRDKQQTAQSKFMADKLETMSQELFDLRSEHETKVKDLEDLHRKYEIALQTLAKFQDTDMETSSRQQTAQSSRPQSFLGDAGMNITGGIPEDGPTSSSRSLESELSSLRSHTSTLAEELSRNTEAPTEEEEEEEEEEGEEMGEDLEGTDAEAGASPLTPKLQVEDLDPADVPLPEDDDDNVTDGEVGSLRKQHSEQQDRVKELTESYTALQREHQAALGKVEDLKLEVQRSQLHLSLRPSSPSFQPSLRSPTSLRRKNSQDLVSSMTGNDRTTRSFASLRNIALDNFEQNPDVRQKIELELNNIMTELHDRSKRVEALDGEIQQARRDMEAKQQIISGLTRERSSLQASSGVDITVVGQMQSQLEQSERQIRSLQESHAEKEKEWLVQHEELKKQLGAHKDAAVPGLEESSRELDTSEDDSHVSRLQKELDGWAAKHKDATDAMKASEAGLLATITTLEASHEAAEEHVRHAESRHAETTATLKAERKKHDELVADLQKQVDEYKAASQNHAEQLTKLQQSHSAIVEQFEEHTKAKDLTDKELQTHKELVSNLDSQLESHKATIALHESNLETILGNLKDSHADEVRTIRESHETALKEANDKHAALIEEHEKATRSLVEQHEAALSSLQEEVKRKQNDMNELLLDASGLFGHETDIARFHGHLADALKKNGAAQERQADTVGESVAMQEKLEAALAKAQELESKVSELAATNAEMVQSLEETTKKEKKSSRLVQELEEQLTSNFDEQQAATNRLSAMQERQVQLEEASSAKNELEKELEDSKLKISLLESQLTDLRRRSLASTSRDSFNRDSTATNPPTFNRDSLSPEAAAIALARSSSGGSHGPRPRSTQSQAPTTALPSPPPAIPLPPLPTSTSLSTINSANGIDVRTAGEKSPPGTPLSSNHHSFQSTTGGLGLGLTGLSATPSPSPAPTVLPDPGLTSKIEEQETRIRTIEKHLFAEKQLTATLEEALIDLETSQNRTRQDLDGWKRKAKELEDELVGLRKEKTNSRASLQQVEEEREMRVRAERARTALEERMKELNAIKEGGKKKKKGGALNCF